MELEILSGILASKYRKEILLILADVDLETPSGIWRKMLEKGYKSANKQNVSSSLRWLKDRGLVKVEIERRKGKLYKITDKGKKHVSKIS